jgi:hypothetical protein
MIGVGTLTTGITARVDEHGTVYRGTVQLGWRVRSGNDWLVPGRDAPTRQSRPVAAPVVHTALRVARGDAIERVYAVGEGDRDIVVVEVENDSPDAIAVAFVVDGPGVVAFDALSATVDGAPALAFARGPGAIEAGNQVVFPVPHRTTARVAFTTAATDVRALADAAAVGRAWDRILDRGLRTELPEPLQSEVDAARADLLLAAPSAAAFATLESWGFDGEAIEMWARLPMRARRAARRAARGAGVLGTTLTALVREHGEAIEVLPGFHAAWLGVPIAVHDLPLRRGPCSFALRWHGARPAVLWDVPPGTTVRAPALDPAWSSDDPVGETLLAEPPTSLLAMGERAAVAGTNVDAPEQFS